MPTLTPTLMPTATRLGADRDRVETGPPTRPDASSPQARPGARTLSALLDRCQAFAPEYAGGLSTHLPMALQALHGLGAPPARLHALFDTIASRLPLRLGAAGQPPCQARPPPRDGLQASPPQPPPTPALANPDDWPALRGRIEAFEALRQALACIAARDGLAATLTAALPLLMPGVAAVALHGLIRSAHAVAAGHADELISGLAYWAARHAPLVVPAAAAPPPATRSLAAWLAGLQALPMPAGVASNRIHQRMQAHAGVAGFAAVAGALALDEHTLDALARHAAGLYAASGNFTVLHLVTGCQAMRVLLPWLAGGPGALRPFCIAAAAALRASGLRQIEMAPLSTPSIPNLAAVPLPWAETVRRAIASDDEHVIKLVQACRCHHAATGAAVFQAAASRAVQDSPPAPRSTTPPTAPAPTPP